MSDDRHFHWEDDFDDESCDHDYFDTDILTGIATCERCGERRMLSNEEIQAQIRHEAAYQQLEAQWNRQQWWSDLFYNVRHPLQALHWSLYKRGWFRPRVTDDEIPF